MKIYVFKNAERGRNYAKTEQVAELVRLTFGAAAEVEYKSSGAPYIINAGQAYISVSHSKGAAAVALSRKPVGIDLELIRPYPERVQRKYSAAERAYVLQHGDLGFFEIWTFKEAVLKCLEKGLREGISGVPAIFGGRLKKHCKGLNIVCKSINRFCLCAAFEEDTDCIEILEV